MFLVIAATELTCNYPIITAPGTYTSPGYREDGTGTYADNLGCNWELDAGVGQVQYYEVSSPATNYIEE